MKDVKRIGYGNRNPYERCVDLRLSRFYFDVLFDSYHVYVNQERYPEYTVPVNIYLPRMCTTILNVGCNFNVPGMYSVVIECCLRTLPYTKYDLEMI